MCLVYLNMYNIAVYSTVTSCTVIYNTVFSPAWVVSKFPIVEFITSIKLYGPMNVKSTAFFLPSTPEKERKERERAQ